MNIASVADDYRQYRGQLRGDSSTKALNQQGSGILGGLEPHFRVVFAAIFQGLSLGISIRVETCGK
jgi:hypothetical protein